MSQQPYGQDPGRPMPPTYTSGQQQPYGSQPQGGAAYGSQPQQPYGSQQPAYGSQPQGGAYGSQPQGGGAYGSQPQQSYGSQPQGGAAYGSQPQSYGQQQAYGQQQSYGQPAMGGLQQSRPPGPGLRHPLPPQAYGPGSQNFWQPTESERSAAMWTHLGTLLIGWLMPLIMFIMKKDESAFVREHARQSLNAQIMNAILCYGIMLISLPLMLVFIGFITFWLAFIPPIIYIVFEIIAAVAANKGEGYKIPMKADMVK
ncbi:DUF4870 domain-containing protein [Brevibacterium sp. R8603A2]|uniref:DUF4870 domain-containing protein n=1 Tax=Brevibacterium pityocampae TaxID=506594 RepID=A0ABP8JPB1_9MICO|nr:DUF4870 domain-containing protein [Brevibacterium sp. R8603A2]MCK1803736.1 DUF4870 domain-containing protein [Brevibacterium sp. R8603A2]